jgi:hypothetical protein
MLCCVVDVMQSRPLLRDAFLIRNATGGWRAPYVGELCCRRPALADTLKRGGQLFDSTHIMGCQCTLSTACMARCRCSCWMLWFHSKP